MLQLQSKHTSTHSNEYKSIVNWVLPMVTPSSRSSCLARDGATLVMSGRSTPWTRPASHTTISSRDAVFAYRPATSRAASSSGSGAGTLCEERIGWGSDGAGGTVWERERSWPALNALAMSVPGSNSRPLCLRHVEGALYERSLVPSATGVFHQ